MKNLRFVRMALLAAGLMLVHRTTSAQVVTTLAGSGAVGSVDGNGAEASFAYPLGLAVGPSGSVYVADTGSLKIRKITPEGLVTTLAGDGRPGYEDGIGTQARFWGPLGVAADASGNVWVADSDDGFDGAYIKKITPGGVVVNLILYPGFNPVAVAFDKSGSLYVLDLDGGLWKISDLKIILLTTVVPTPSARSGVAVDGAGNVYFSGRDKIQKITPDGTVTTLAGSGSPGSADGAGTSASFRGPNGLAVDSSRNVYVADRDNNTIRKITSSGIVTTLAGSASPGSADGTGTAASFYSPAGVALDASGNLYVADSGNQKIRKITFPGSTEACVSDLTTLCLSGGRFRVTTQWATATGQSGLGQAVALAGGDTGYFTFFDPGNVEVAVKVLNGCGSNGSFWIFAGGLTDVSVVMTVTDSQTGTAKSYTNPQGTRFRPIQDATTFATCAAGATAGARPYDSSAGAPLLPPKVAESIDASATAPCVANATTLCLSNSRYQVRAQWLTQDGSSGAGQVIPLTGDTGAFWFFSPSNVEVVIKVLNGCGVNSRYWTFAGGLTNVNVILTVTDTQTGTIQTYTNPQGTPFEPIQDTNTFSTCS
jgi:serine/threonine protein kinase, bacterial